MIKIRMFDTGAWLPFVSSEVWLAADPVSIPMNPESVFSLIILAQHWNP